jgi:hypothetical protein
MKYFALFVFIPLVLYRYRRINKLVGILVVGMVLVAISMVIILNSSGGSAAIANEDYYVNVHILRFNDVNIQMGEYTPIGLLGFFYMVLCVLAYIAPNTENKQKKQYTMWLLLAGYMCFFLFYYCNIYWYVLLAPFLILLSYSSHKKRKINLVLELVFSTMILIKYIYTQDWVFMGEKTYSYLVLKQYGTVPNQNLIQIILNSLIPTLESFLPLIQGITYASAIMLLVINFPTIKINQDEPEEELEKDVNIVTWIRIVIIYVWIIISIVGLVVSQV